MLRSKDKYFFSVKKKDVSLCRIFLYFYWCISIFIVILNKLNSMKTNFSKQDIDFINQRGSNIEVVTSQINNFESGFPFVNLKAPATKDNGLKAFSENEVESFIGHFEDCKSENICVKFVPASGAATRMFKTLHEAYNLLALDKNNYNQLIEKKGFDTLSYFVEHINMFAFYPELKSELSKQNLDIDVLLKDNDYLPILDCLLFEKGLNYSALPKALISFHKYDNEIRKAVIEHLVEGIQYANNDGNVKIHFTLSPEHIAPFEALLKTEQSKYERNLKFDISHSFQKASTDTIAVDLNNEPFRGKNDKLVFRPAGHGALIENLNEIDADIIFVKNIDNVVPDSLKETTYKYKKALAGFLLSVQEVVFDYVDSLSNSCFNERLVADISDFVNKTLNISLPEDWKDLDLIEKVDWLHEKLNRPIRICGMVKNEGEPGGGPFWIEKNGEQSLQIIESSQIDMNNPKQKDIFSKSSHFNPVDIVCAVKDYMGEKFDLLDYVDSETGFISIKSKDGRDLKAQELPGLWNGAMANWITIFVEVPAITFNPVKVVNDLLRDTHQ